MSKISQGAIDLIVASEVSSRATYEKKYKRPEWPGGASGVTVGIGYDLGYATVEKVGRDWSQRLPAQMVSEMQKCCGVSGSTAQIATAQVRSRIEVSWEHAIAVFDETDMPEWIARVCKVIPGADKLHPDCLGALVSIAYNRGASFNTQGDRYAEMRAIRQHVISGELAKVPYDIRAMKRLWPGVNGLLARRDAEARLFEKGLIAKPVDTTKPVAPIVIREAPAPLTPSKPAGKVEGGTAGGIIVAGSTAAGNSGMSAGMITFMVIASVVAGVVAWLIIRNVRSQPDVARQKG